MRAGRDLRDSGHRDPTQDENSNSEHTEHGWNFLDPWMGNRRPKAKALNFQRFAMTIERSLGGFFPPPVKSVPSEPDCARKTAQSLPIANSPSARPRRSKIN
jgi:hypothetical protein